MNQATTPAKDPWVIRQIAMIGISDLIRVGARCPDTRLSTQEVDGNYHYVNFQVKVNLLGVVRTKGKSQWLGFKAVFHLDEMHHQADCVALFRCHPKTQKTVYKMDKNKLVITSAQQQSWIDRLGIGAHVSDAPVLTDAYQEAGNIIARAMIDQEETPGHLESLIDAELNKVDDKFKELTSALTEVLKGQLGPVLTHEQQIATTVSEFLAGSPIRDLPNDEIDEQLLIDLKKKIAEVYKNSFAMVPDHPYTEQEVDTISVAFANEIVDKNRHELTFKAPTPVGIKEEILKKIRDVDAATIADIPVMTTVYEKDIPLVTVCDPVKDPEAFAAMYGDKLVGDPSLEGAEVQPLFTEAAIEKRTDLTPVAKEPGILGKVLTGVKRVLRINSQPESVEIGIKDTSK